MVVARDRVLIIISIIPGGAVHLSVDDGVQCDQCCGDQSWWCL